MKFGSIDKWVKRVPFESTPPLSEPIVTPVSLSDPEVIPAALSDSEVIPAGQPEPDFEPAWTGTPVSLSDDDAVHSDPMMTQPSSSNMMMLMWMGHDRQSFPITRCIV